MADDLAGLARFHLVVGADAGLGAHESQPGVGCGTARAARCGPLIEVDGVRVHLGGAVVVDEHVGGEHLHAALHEGARHGRPGVGEGTHRRDVGGGHGRRVDQVVEQRRRQVERPDPLRPDEFQGPGRVPVGLADVAAAHDLGRQQGVDAHGVVQRHHPEGALAGPVALVQGLGEAAGPLGGVAAGHALRPARGARGVQEDGGRPVVQVLRGRRRSGRPAGRHEAFVGLAGCRARAGPQALGEVGRRLAPAGGPHGHEAIHRVPAGPGVFEADLLEYHERRPGIGHAVRHVGRGHPPRERHDHGAQPLARPVQLDGLAAVLQHGGHAVAPAHAERGEPGRHRGSGLLQAPVAQAGVAIGGGVGVRRALGGVEQRETEVHAGSSCGAPAAGGRPHSPPATRTRPPASGFGPSPERRVESGSGGTDVSRLTGKGRQAEVGRRESRSGRKGISRLRPRRQPRRWRR